MFFPFCDEVGAWLIPMHSTSEVALLASSLFCVPQETVALVEILLFQLSRRTEHFGLQFVFRAWYENSKLPSKLGHSHPFFSVINHSRSCKHIAGNLVKVR